MIGWVERLWAKIYLWNYGYCTKHLTEKEVTVYDGGCVSECKECEDEAKERTRVNLVSAMMTLSEKKD
jgi:hypothetical protein